MTGAGGERPDARDDLLRSMVAMVALDGVVSAVERAEEHGLVGQPPAVIESMFGSAYGLLDEAARTVAAIPVLLPPREGDAPDSVRGTVEALASEHRVYVDVDAARFAAVVQFASAGIFGHRSLLAPMANRNRRTKLAVRARLAQFRAGALTTADIASIAETFVDTVTGVEMCHLMDGDQDLRHRAYAQLVDATVARIEAGLADGEPPGLPSSLTFHDDFRLRVVLDPQSVVIDVLEVSGIDGWDSRIFVGRHFAALAGDVKGDDSRSAVWLDRLELARIDPMPVTYAGFRPAQDLHESEQVTCVVTPVHGQDRQLQSILLDIQDHSASIARERERREVENQRSSAVELTGLGCYVAYIREPRMDSDARFDEIYGINPQELMEREGFDGFFDVMHVEDAPKVRQALEAAMTGEVDYIASYRLWAQRPDGPELRWIEALGRVESDEHGPLRVIGVIDDVTDRRKVQEAQLRAQKREAIGTLSAGIAHDFNNVLGAVLANAIVARDEVEAGQSPLVSVHEIERGAKRAAELVQRLLAFSREEDPRREPFDLAKVVDEACGLLRPTLGADVELRQSAVSALPLAIGDETQLHQVIVNLIVNADHAIGPKPGVIAVSVASERRTESAAESLEGLPPGDYLRLEVEDDGPGVPDRIAQRIFDPFFTTSPAGGSTGLGLSSSQAIVTNHGGSITVENVPEGGARFVVLMPCQPPVALELPTPPDVAWRTQREGGVGVRTGVPGTGSGAGAGTGSDVGVGAGAGAAGEVDADGTPAEQLPTGGGAGALARVLFLDDEEALARVASRAMPACGCDAITFSDPLEALAAFHTAPDSFDAVITDLTMPTMSGFDFIREVREIRPLVPVVLTSGFLTRQTEDEARRQHVGYVVPKPWSVDELATKTLDLIDRSGGAGRWQR